VLQAVKVKLPEDTQRAEFMLEHGMLDAIVPRGELHQTLATILRHYCVRLAGAQPQPVALAGLAMAGGA